MRRPTCAEVQELAPELALDLLTGAERAAVLAHLEGCTACRGDVGALTDVGDAVLSLAHGSEPSAGFESRVLERIAGLRDGAGAGGPAAPPAGSGAPVGGPPVVPPADAPGEPPAASPAAPDFGPASVGGPPAPPVAPPSAAPADDPVPARGRRRRLVPALAAVAAAAVVAAVLVVGGRDAAEPPPSAAQLRTGDGRVVGEATLSDGDPAVVTLDMSDWLAEVRRYGDPDRTYWLTVEGAPDEGSPAEGGGDGEDDVYALPVREPGPWHVPLDGTDAGRVTSVTVVDDTGRSVCEARFAER